MTTLAKHMQHLNVDTSFIQLVKYYDDKDNLGTVQLSICTTCSWIRADCLHEKNFWNKEETELRCYICNLEVS